jgi:hypothetical protein
MTGQRKYRSLRGGWGILALALAGGFGGMSLQAGDGPIGLIVQRSLLAPEMFQEIQGAKETVLAPGRQISAGVDTFSSAEWAAEKLEWPEVMAGAMEIADRLVEELEVEWKRDANGVILYGEAVSGSPFLGSVMFSKRFLGQFKDELGAEFYVVIPEQGRMFLFPRFGGKLDDYGASMAGVYQGSALRISLEVFLVNEAGCRAVGTLGDAPQK